MPSSLPHTASRGLSVRLPHVQQCSALKFMMLFIWTADVQYLSSPVVAVLESQSLASLAVLHPRVLQVQRTEDSGFPHRTVAAAQRHFCSFFFDGGCLPVILHCGRPGWTIIFYSTAPRPFQMTQCLPPIHSE